MDAVVDANACSARIVAARFVAGVGQQTGQLVVTGVFRQPQSQCGLHFLQAIVQIVFQAARDGFFQRNRTCNWCLPNVHACRVLLNTDAHFVLRCEFGSDAATGQK